MFGNGIMFSPEKKDNQRKRGGKEMSNRKRNILLLKYFPEDCKFSYYFIASGEKIYGLS